MRHICLEKSRWTINEWIQQRTTKNLLFFQVVEMPILNTSTKFEIDLINVWEPGGVTHRRANEYEKMNEWIYNAPNFVDFLLNDWF